MTIARVTGRLLPVAAFAAGAWRSAGLPMPSDAGFHLVRAGNHLLEASPGGWAIPPGGEHAPVLGALLTAFGALFADTAEAKLVVAGCVLAGLAAALLFRTLAESEGPVVAVAGTALLVLPAGFAASFNHRPDAGAGGVLMLLAVSRALRRETTARVVAPLWIAAFATPWAWPGALAAHAWPGPGRGDRRALFAPLAALAVFVALSLMLPPAARGEILRGLLSDVRPFAQDAGEIVRALRIGWTHGLLAAAFLLAQLFRPTRLPARALVPWCAAAAAAIFAGGPGAFWGATATLAPTACLGLARGAHRAGDVATREPLRRPVVLAMLLALLAFFLGGGTDRDVRAQLRRAAAREAQIGSFLFSDPTPGAVLAPRTGAIAAFSGRPAFAILSGDLPEPPPRWIVLSEGRFPGPAERTLFENPEFLANYAAYDIRRGREREIQDVVWVRRAASAGTPDPPFLQALLAAQAARTAGDDLAARDALRAAADAEPAGLGFAREEWGLELESLGNDPASRAALEAARREDVACIRARGHLADRAISRGEILLADSLVAEAFRFHRGLAELHGIRARLLAEAGWAADAESESARAVDAGPTVARVLVNHGILLWRRGAAALAREMWRRAVRADPATLRYLGAFEDAPDDASAPPLGPVFTDLDFRPRRPPGSAPSPPPAGSE